jgi:hypothetical protein
LAAERVASGFEVSFMLPILAGMHVICLVLLFRISRKKDGVSENSRVNKEIQANSLAASLRILRERPYLKSLAIMVLLGTMAAALIDYVFKAQATASVGGAEGLLRFFAIYYTVIGLVTVILQGGLSRISLERLGLVRTVMILPAALILGVAGAIFSPRLSVFTLLRGTEVTIRNSLYRSAYELLYTPVPPGEKRSTKPIIDVGFERLGDALGGGTVKLVLMTGPQLVIPIMLGLAGVLSVAGLLVGRRLHRGYINALERSLQRRAVELEMSEVEDRTTRQTLIHTMANLNIDEIRSQVSRIERSSDENDDVRSESRFKEFEKRLNPVLQDLSMLQSGEPEQVLRILNRPGELDKILIPQAIQLLAWDHVASNAMRELRRSGSKIVGQLTDQLLDREQDFTIRRRIPLVLCASDDKRAIDGLMAGLKDPRFEVRFRCGTALSRISQMSPYTEMNQESVFEAVLREVAVDRRVWDSHRLLDQFDHPDDKTPFIDEFLKDRVNKSLEHVFTLLALVLPKEPLKISFLGLLTEDQNLRGTALEYLESVLPVNVKEALWPYLDDKKSSKSAKKTTKSKNEILEDLMKSNLSIQISLEEIKREEKGRNNSKQKPE